MFLSLWLVTSIGVTYQIFCISDVYILIHNRSKILVVRKQQDMIEGAVLNCAKEMRNSL